MLQPKHILKPQHLSLLEAPPRFELGNKGFADLCLTTWLWRRFKRQWNKRQALPL